MVREVNRSINTREEHPFDKYFDPRFEGGSSVCERILGL